MIDLKYGTSLVGARDEYGFPIEVYDDFDGPLWAFGDEGGLRMIIRARCFETAWEIMVDEAKTISEDEVPEAYGFWGEHAELELRQAVERAEAGAGDYPELEEGYELQSNCTGTGIVNVGHYAWLRELTVDALRTLHIRLLIQPSDLDQERLRVECESYAFTLVMDDGEGGERRWRQRSFALLSDVGEAIANLEQIFGILNVEVTWQQS